jgi:hypothetical protein
MNLYTTMTFNYDPDGNSPTMTYSYDYDFDLPIVIDGSGARIEPEFLAEPDHMVADSMQVWLDKLDQGENEEDEDSSFPDEQTWYYDSASGRCRPISDETSDENNFPDPPDSAT